MNLDEIWQELPQHRQIDLLDMIREYVCEHIANCRDCTPEFACRGIEGVVDMVERMREDIPEYEL